jgi:hypothetical protein
LPDARAIFVERQRLGCASRSLGRSALDLDIPRFCRIGLDPLP